MQADKPIVKKTNHRMLFIGIILGLSIFIIIFSLVSLRGHFSDGSRSGFSEVSYGMSIAGDDSMEVFIADEPTERALGLSIFDNLADNQGMLFVFDEFTNHPFWMKGMSFPIDIIWLDGDSNIVFIKENALPSDYPNSYNPGVPSLYVMEFVSGFVGSHGLAVGDSLGDFYE